MDAKQLARIIQQRLGLEDQEFSSIRENPKFQRPSRTPQKGHDTDWWPRWWNPRAASQDAGWAKN